MPIERPKATRAANWPRSALTRFRSVISQLSGAVSSPIAGPLAAWMPPSSPHGRVYGVSRKR
ncbi:hypothetical protein BJD12_01325 [Xanthomonas vesicatoria ATCC 35937]|nr:hypothetical protein BJD12_01325 [Xanthomonas vesicatoria ATCC 35937]